MSNFILGVQSALYNLHSLLFSIVQYPLFWGFAIGFLVSTIVHAFLMSDHPSHIPLILAHEPSTSFEKIYSKAGGAYSQSYTVFEKMASTTKFIFSLSIFIFMLAVLWAVLQYMVAVNFPQFAHFLRLG